MRKGLGGLIVGVMLAAVVVAWPWLPENVPTHWNIRGEVDGRMPRFPGVFLAPAVALGMWLLLPLLRKLDPRRENYERFDETFWLVVNVLLGFLAAVHALLLAAAVGWPVDVARWLVALLGVMMIVLGNYLPRVRSNWWMGVRTPWTLESERVWRDTHRLAGRTFVAGGVLAVGSALLPIAARFWVVVVAIMAAALVPAVYSYVLWRRERRQIQP
jgi:uncharacterized membrane protein